MGSNSVGYQTEIYRTLLKFLFILLLINEKQFRIFNETQI